MAPQQRVSILKEHSGLLEFVLRVADPIVLSLIGLVLFYFKFDDLDLPAHYQMAFIAVFVAILAVFPFFRLYRPFRGQSLWTELNAILRAWGTIVIGFIVFMFLSKTSAAYSREWMATWALSGFAGLVVFRIALRVALRMLRRRGMNLRHVAIAGAGALGEEIAQRLRSAPWTGLAVKGFYDDVKPAGDRIAGLPILGTLDDLASDAQAGHYDQVWLALPLRAEAAAKHLLEGLRKTTAEVRFVPDIYGFQLLNHSLTEIAGLPVINLTESPMNGSNRFAKAVMDYVLATLALVVLSPLLLILAIGVKLSSRGPIIYEQERVTWNGQRFMLYKFRSMPVDAEAQGGPVWARPGEDRATPFGRWMRRYSLDELPQFLNVLKGDMSIVGPRPERPEFILDFKEQIPGYMQKHLMKAGITGWAQVNDLRGNTDLTKRIEHDLFYIENWSPWFDLRIMAITVLKIFASRHAY